MVFRVLLLSLWLTMSARGAELLWPLPGHETITGGFADVRPDHFHGGVDVSTARQTVPVVAPDDGWIERMAVTPGGYGRTLYYRISENRTAVFAHLSRFHPILEEMMRDSQLVAGTYRVNVSYEYSAPDRCFKAGDTLAYTGKTGAGPMHFHYEIREGAVQTDPFAFYDKPDDELPVISSISWTPLSTFTPWNSGKSLKLSRIGQGHYRTEAIRANEPVAFFVRTYDPNPWMRPAVPAVIRIKVDGRTVFEDQATRIDLLGLRDIYAKTVWPDRTHSRMGLRRLFEMMPKTGPADSLSRPAGWLSGLNKTTVQIEVQDRTGNISRCEIPVTAGDWPQTSAVIAEELNCGRFTLTTNNDAAASWAVMDIASSETEIKFGPANFAFGDRLRLTYETDDFRGRYFYERTAKGGRKPLAAITDSISAYPGCLILRTGTYGVGIDNDPPNLTLSVHAGTVRFKLSDGLSGINDASIRCTVDGLPAIAEFEHEERGGNIWTPQPLAKGSHTISITAADRAGNRQTWHDTINVP